MNLCEEEEQPEQVLWWSRASHKVLKHIGPAQEPPKYDSPQATETEINLELNGRQ